MVLLQLQIQRCHWNRLRELMMSSNQMQMQRPKRRRQQPKQRQLQQELLSLLHQFAELALTPCARFASQPEAAAVVNRQLLQWSGG